MADSEKPEAADIRLPDPELVRRTMTDIAERSQRIVLGWLKRQGEARPEKNAPTDPLNIGGAFLEMGQPFLLQSLGAVVLGGTLIFGGSGTAVGTLFGALLLVLIVTTMQIAQLPPGAQDVVEGVVIIAVLALAGGGAVRRRVRSGRTTATP